MPATIPVPEEDQFVFLYRSPLRKVSRCLLKLPNPALAYAILCEAFCAMDHNTGVVRLEAKDVADVLGCRLAEVNEAIECLRRASAFYVASDGWKDFDKAAINPDLAWKGTLAHRTSRKRMVSAWLRPAAGRSL